MAERRKKLVEVALPLTEINDASSYDKMPGIGPHPKGIHHWWARLPLPCARAILLASLIDDPSSDPDFAEATEDEREIERRRLFGVIEGVLQKRSHENDEKFRAAIAEISRSSGNDLPVVLDPFSGGGSVPLEAHRLGMISVGTDLNPVAVLITKVAAELVPQFLDCPPVHPDEPDRLVRKNEWQGSQGLAEDVRYYANKIQRTVEKRVGHLYPTITLPHDHGGRDATVVAWVWARTVKCPNPACGAQMPLVRSFRLASKGKRKAWVDPVVDKSSVPPQISYTVKTGAGTPRQRTVTRKGATCIACDQPVSFDYISKEGKAGRIEPKLMAIAAQGKRAKIYLPPDTDHENAAKSARPHDVPDTDLPDKALGFRVQRYGMTKHKHLHTPRQLATLEALSDAIRDVRGDVAKAAASCSNADQYANLVITLLGFALDRCVDFGTALCRWVAGNEKVMNLFGRSAIPMTWDFAEANMLGNAVGGWATCSEYVAKCVEVIPVGNGTPATITQKDAVSAGDGNRRLLVSTDPPYYDNIGYSDLSDCFYVWLRRTIGDLYPDICSTVLVPKTPELVAAPDRFGGDAGAARDHFEGGFKEVFGHLRDHLDPRFPMTVYYAFKQSDEVENEDDDSDEASPDSVTVTTGWETMLEGLVSTGFQITATWPVRASQAWRMRAMGSNALASYVVLACRPRPDDSVVATKRQFLGALKSELPDALRKLQQGNIAPVDLAQAAIGPGMAVFSRYSKVVESDGSPMTVRTAIALINQSLDEVLAEQEGEFDGDTRWAVAWFEQFGIAEGEYGVAETLSKAKNTSVQGLVDAGVITARGGKVKLIARESLPEDWDPNTDARPTCWEATQHLIRRLQHQGEQAAAELLARLGGDYGERARDLAYRLYNVSERKGWAQEALAYNSLVTAWSEINKLSRTVSESKPAKSAGLFE